MACTCLMPEVSQIKQCTQRVALSHPKPEQVAEVHGMRIELEIASSLTISQVDVKVWALCRILMSMKQQSQLV